MERQIIEACHASSRSTSELLSVLGYAVRTGNFKRGLKRLIAAYLLEMSMPGKPRSRNQKYRLSKRPHLARKGKVMTQNTPQHRSYGNPKMWKIAVKSQYFIPLRGI